MRYSIWISTPSPEEAQAIAAQAATVAAEEFDFAIRELDGGAGLPSATDLAFHVDSDAGPEDAKAQALQAYALCRAEAGLSPDGGQVARLAIQPHLR